VGNETLMLPLFPSFFSLSALFLLPAPIISFIYHISKVQRTFFEGKELNKELV